MKVLLSLFLMVGSAHASFEDGNYISEVLVPGMAPFQDTVYCEAHTVCANGRQIWCNSHGVSCRSHENNGIDVVCMGYDLAHYQGVWHQAADRCP